ncbi:MAG: manganese efflux pump MntP family protein [Clostridiales bacterium]|jgi:putative Mn2+ efflux pump MntP|nr:manganese efflux pump MntP family protein [Clostridiales bacterium]
MSPAAVFLIALGLAADAFAVSVANGITMKNYKVYYSLVFGFYFGIFQFLMPVAGFYAGRVFTDSIEQWSAYIAFGLLSLIGGKMIWESFFGTDDEEMIGSAHIFSAGRMCMLALATSMDALAVGFSFALLDVPLLAASSVIGAVAFVLSGLGVAIGKKVSGFFKKGAECAGGLILIAIGARILISRLAGGA